MDDRGVRPLREVPPGREAVDVGDTSTSQEAGQQAPREIAAPETLQEATLGLARWEGAEHTTVIACNESLANRGIHAGMELRIDERGNARPNDGEVAAATVNPEPWGAWAVSPLVLGVWRSVPDRGGPPAVLDYDGPEPWGRRQMPASLLNWYGMASPSSSTNAADPETPPREVA
jgi:hypothetical protein